MLVLVGALWTWARHQNAVHSGARLDDLAGDEPPAVVNLLVHGMKVSVEAATATALDLAARGHIDIDEINSTLSLVHVHHKRRHHDELLGFEQRVLDALSALEVDGVVPAEACSLGPEAMSWRWWRRFSIEVGDEAVRRGLSRHGLFGPAWWYPMDDSAISRWWLMMFVLLALPPWLLLNGTQNTNDLVAWLVLFSYLVPLAAAASVTRIRYIASRQGRTAATRWTGTRAWLQEADFDQHPPAGVRIWGRPLAYAVALGLARHTARGLPFGAEDDVHAWSPAGGRWHPVRITYPMWLPGWGRRTGRVLVWSLVVAITTFVAALGMWSWRAAPAGRATAVLFFVVASAALVESFVAAVDLGPGIEIDGEVVRLRATFPDFERGLLTIVVHRPRWFVAVENKRQRIRAISIQQQDFDQLAEGDHVRLTVSRILKHARAIRIVDEEAGEDYVVRDSAYSA